MPTKNTYHLLYRLRHAVEQRRAIETYVCVSCPGVGWYWYTPHRVYTHATHGFFERAAARTLGISRTVQKLESTTRTRRRSCCCSVIESLYMRAQRRRQRTWQKFIFRLSYTYRCGLYKHPVSPYMFSIWHVSQCISGVQYGMVLISRRRLEIFIV